MRLRWNDRWIEQVIIHERLRLDQGLWNWKENATSWLCIFQDVSVFLSVCLQPSSCLSYLQYLWQAWWGTGHISDMLRSGWIFPADITTQQERSYWLSVAISQLRLEDFLIALINQGISVCFSAFIFFAYLISYSPDPLRTYITGDLDKWSVSFEAV